MRGSPLKTALAAWVALCLVLLSPGRACAALAIRTAPAGTSAGAIGRAAAAMGAGYMSVGGVRGGLVSPRAGGVLKLPHSPIPSVSISPSIAGQRVGDAAGTFTAPPEGSGIAAVRSSLGGLGEAARTETVLPAKPAAGSSAHAGGSGRAAAAAASASHGPASTGFSPLPALKAVASKLRDAVGGGSLAGRGVLRGFFDRSAPAKPGSGRGAAAVASPVKLPLKRFQVPTGLSKPVDIGAENPSQTGVFKDKGKRGNRGNKKAWKAMKRDRARLTELAAALQAEGKRSVLIVLQAMDAAGKDGAVRYVFGTVDPQALRVTSFKKPTEEEASHHYLWRIRNALPRAGQIGVFNRSHYEDILVPGVFGTLPAELVEPRYDEINEFERELTERGVTILKFFLNISKGEQKRRFWSRLTDPLKRWKFRKADLKARERWPDFMETYGRVLARTSTPWAPWYIIPADNKWFRNFLIARILRKVLKRLSPRYPDPERGLKKVEIPD